MDRPILYTGQIARDYDLLHAWRDNAKAMAAMIAHVTSADLVAPGGSPVVPPAIVTGLVASGSGGLAMGLTDGYIYELAALDASQYGSLAGTIDAAEAGVEVLQQGYFPGGSIALSAPPSGQFRWALVQASFQQVDAARAGDPSGGLLPFYNASNPAVPLAGQNNNGQPLPTVRLGQCSVQVIYGAQAGSAGAAVPPSPTSGFVPLYLVLLTGSTATVSDSIIAVAGPSVTSNTGTAPSDYPAAPFLRGLTASHHLGVPGSAPKIDGSKEWLPTADVDNNGQKLANIAAGAASGDAINFGQVAALVAAQFTGTDANPGYVKLPSGLIIQWGSISTATPGTAGSAVLVSGTFGHAFTAAPFALFGYVQQDSGYAGFVTTDFSPGITTATDLGLWVNLTSNAPSGVAARYIAIGI